MKKFDVQYTSKIILTIVLIILLTVIGVVLVFGSGLVPIKYLLIIGYKIVGIFALYLAFIVTKIVVNSLKDRKT